MSTVRKAAFRTAAVTTAAAGTLLGLAALTPATAMAAMIPAQHSTQAAHPNFEQQMVNANMTDHTLDVTIELADGTTLHQDMAARSGWYPNADFTGVNTLTIRDSQGVAMKATFTFDQVASWAPYDWHLLKVDPGSRIQYTWHTGNFGGFDFR